MKDVVSLCATDIGQEVVDGLIAFDAIKVEAPKKGDTQLATKINNAIVDMIQDGSWENAISDNTKGTNYTPDVRYNPPTPDEGEEA